MKVSIYPKLYLELTKIQIDNKAYSSSSCHFPGQN